MPTSRKWPCAVSVWLCSGYRKGQCIRRKNYSVRNCKRTRSNLVPENQWNSNDRSSEMTMPENDNTGSTVGMQGSASLQRWIRSASSISSLGDLFHPPAIGTDMFQEMASYRTWTKTATKSHTEMSFIVISRAIDNTKKRRQKFCHKICCWYFFIALVTPLQCTKTLVLLLLMVKTLSFLSVVDLVP